MTGTKVFCMKVERKISDVGFRLDKPKVYPERFSESSDVVSQPMRKVRSLMLPQIPKFDHFQSPEVRHIVSFLRREGTNWLCIGRHNEMCDDQAYSDDIILLI